MEILSVKGLSFTYPNGDAETLHNISFTVGEGDFVTVCGATGSGKTTLLRMLKREMAPVGKRTGEIQIDKRPEHELSDRDCAALIGYVMQDPEQQLVTDKVWHELAFGLENLGYPTEVIRRRVAETASWFGIDGWFEKNISELSGGQKQLLNLASVMVMRPKILLLDEPTAQLDPISASNLISTVSKLNRELALTVIITEHRLDEVIPVSDNLMVLENGSILAYGDARETVEKVRGKRDLLMSMPASVRLYSCFDTHLPCPLDIRSGRAFIESNFQNIITSLPEKQSAQQSKPALEFSEVFFRYTREQPDVLHDLSFTVNEGEIFCILGGNGSGKSTALSAAAALLRPYSGSIKIFGRKQKEYGGISLYRECLSLLPQDVQTCFLHNTVREELSCDGVDTSSLPFDLEALYNKHPYDLSGGQQQLVALSKALASHPRLLLLDEPTKGVDACAKATFAEILKKQKEAGTTVVCVTHDVEFAALCADRCALLFRGEVTSCDTARSFFAQNCFYTTAVSRMTQGYYEYITTVNDAEAILRANGRRGQA